MRPNSQQGFSPVVHGVARTNAPVKVIQNGNVIYQENVPPGQFTLDSIQPTGSAGDLLVVVREADGSQQSFTVPFSAVPGMLKEGVSQYSVVAGKVHQNTLDAEPAFMQATLRYGFNNLITGYTGTIISDNYRAGLVGTGWNLPFGAVSFDVTHAKTTLQDRTSSGQSYRVSYSKFIDTTATNFTPAAYRYSTKGYYSFSDALYSREGYQRLRAQYDDYEDRFGVAPDMSLSTRMPCARRSPRIPLRLTLISACSITGARYLSPAHSAITGTHSKPRANTRWAIPTPSAAPAIPCRPAGYGTGTVKKRRAFTSPSACRSRCLIIMPGSPPA